MQVVLVSAPKSLKLSRLAKGFDASPGLQMTGTMKLIISESMYFCTSWSDM